MKRHPLQIALLALALALASVASTTPARAVSVTPVLAVVEEDSLPADVDKTSFDAESKTAHVGRINRNMMTATVVILTTFVLLRVGLLWQISRSRKKIAQENILEPKA